MWVIKSDFGLKLCAKLSAISLSEDLQSPECQDRHSSFHPIIISDKPVLIVLAGAGHHDQHLHQTWDVANLLQRQLIIMPLIRECGTLNTCLPK